LYLPADYCLICMNALLQTPGNVNERYPSKSSNPLNIAGFSFLTGSRIVYI
jgi:hypothetical protein